MRRRVPVMFRIAGALLLVSIVGGQVWQRQPGAAATHQIIALAEQYCPAAVTRTDQPTIADGARTLDKWGFRRLADMVDPQPSSRCRASQEGADKGVGTEMKL